MKIHKRDIIWTLKGLPVPIGLFVWLLGMWTGNLLVLVGTFVFLLIIMAHTLIIMAHTIGKDFWD